MGTFPMVIGFAFEKSWLSLWLCLQVAKGEPAWEFPTTQGNVFYLCLKDSYSRIQNRLLDITD